jgi:transposase
MPAERAPMRKVREVLRLRHALGVSERQMAVTVGISRSTVSEYLRRAAVIGITWPVPEGLDDGELERRLFTPPIFDPAPARPLPDWSYVHKELKRRSVTLLLLWEEYRAAHADGYGYSRFCDLYRAWRGSISPTMRQAHGPAEKLFVDFAGDTVSIFDAATGMGRLAHIFVAVLGASNYTYAEARWSEGLADWIGAHVNALTALGGAPKAIVCDNLKAGVTAISRYEPGINRTYQELAEHYGTAILPARPKKPRDKAKVEVAVQMFSASSWRDCATDASSRWSSSTLQSASASPISMPGSCASSASAATSCSLRSIGQRSRLFRRRPIGMPNGKSAASRPIITSRSAITTTRCPRA